MDWEKLITKRLVGRKIVETRYMTAEECDNFGFDNRAILLILDDGNYLCPSADDEGNGAGALFTGYEDLPTIPVFWGTS